MIRITMGCGHITNSSSVVHYFDKALLEDPGVKAFIKAYEMEDGLVGSDMWSRSTCTSFLVNKELKSQANVKLMKEGYEDYPGPQLREDDDSEIVLIYGDEYSNPTHTLCTLLKNAARKAGSGDLGGDEYN